MTLAETLSLIEWRRRVADLYSDIRREPDPLTAWKLWCNTRNQLFGQHAQSPLSAAQKQHFSAIPVFAYDPALRFLVRLSETSGAVLHLPAGADGAVAASPFARTNGLAATLGAELTLYWIGGYGGGVFLPFKDATSGYETFGGGRYLLDGVKSADLGMTPDGRMILDFNFSYAPSCAHSPDYICPLAPPENSLPGAVRGGERS